LGWGLATFVFLHGIAALAFWRQRLDDPIYHFRVRAFEARLHESPPGALRIIMMGSSRVHNGIAGRVIEERVSARLNRPCVAFNFAAAGSGPITQYLYLRRLIEDGCRPDVIVMEYFVANMQAVDGAPAEAKSLLPDRIRPEETSFLANYGFDEPAIHTAHRRALLLPFDYLQQSILAQIEPRLIAPPAAVRACRNFDAWGDHPVTPAKYPYGGRDARISAELRRVPLGIGELGICSAEERALVDMLEFCRREGIRVLLVYMPEHGSIHSLWAPAALAQLREKLAALASGGYCQTVFARDWMPDDAFMDHHHLYFDQADRFTARLCDEVLVPSLESGSGRTEIGDALREP
jgi:hypothetical protein